MNVLIFNLRMDADDPVLGHSAAWANAVADHCEHVTVITMSAGRLNLAKNVTVHSLGKEHGLSEPRRLIRFYRLVAQVQRERRIDACFAHMAPLFAILFSPVARPARIPILLWYAHSSVTRTLRLAEAVVDRCVTSTPAGFRMKSRKLFILGQGIDVKRFCPPEGDGRSADEAIVSIGRISPIKRIEEMADAIGILGERGRTVDLSIFGGAAVDEDRAYEARLRRRVTEGGLDGQVSFEGPVPFERVPAAYHRGGLFLNLTEGALDKTILESMASGCIPVSRNPSFEEIARERGLDLLVAGPGAAGVADGIERVLQCSVVRRSEIATELRGIVVEEHSLDRLSTAIVSHLHELAEAKGRLRP